MVPLEPRVRERLDSRFERERVCVWSQAVVALERAVSLAPETDEALVLRLAAALLADERRGDDVRERALTLLDALLAARARDESFRETPEDDAVIRCALLLRASALSESRESLAFAIADLERAAAVQPPSADALRQLGLARLDRDALLRRDATTTGAALLGTLDAEKAELARGAARALREALELAPRDLGALHGLARAEERVAEEEEASSEKNSSSVRVATFASDARCGLRRLLQSAAAQVGLQQATAVLAPAADERWSNGLKLRLLARHARQLPPTALLLVVDGFDVVLCGDAAQLERAWHRFEHRSQRRRRRRRPRRRDEPRGGDERASEGISDESENDSNDSADVEGPGRVLVSADQTFYFRGAQEQCYGERYPAAQPRSPYRFLNSGSLLGRARDVAALCEWVRSSQRRDT